jgi:hypothetical protein
MEGSNKNSYGQGLSEDDLVDLGFSKHLMVGTGWVSISSMRDAVYYYKKGRITINATYFWTWFLDKEQRNDIAVDSKEKLSLLLKELDANNSPSNACQYSVAWIGTCKKPADESGFCEEHKKEKCASCGSQATHSCDETMGLCCGAPLCDQCEHTIQSNGCNSGGKLPDGYKMHCPKDKQVYKPWWMHPNVTPTN